LNHRLGRFAKLFCLLLLVSFFLIGQSHSVFAEAQQGAGYDSTILAVDVVGNEHIPVETILKAVTHVRLGEAWNAEKVNQDIRSIQGMGYFSSVEASGEPFLGGVKLLFHVQENPLFKEISIKGLNLLKPSVLLPFFTQKKGQVINTSQLVTDMDAATQSVRDNQGYFLITKDMNVSAEGVITLSITEVKVRKLSVEGLQKTKEIVVRRELSVKEGNILNLNDIRDDIQRIYRLGILENINPLIQNTVDPEWVDIVIQVSEVEKLGQFYFGFGYAPKSGKLTANTSLSYPNLGGMGRNGSLNLQIGKEERTFSVEYSDPWFLPSHVSLQTRLYYDDLVDEYYITDKGRIDEDDLYNINDMGLYTGLGWTISKNWKLGTFLDVKKVQLDTMYDHVDHSGDGNQDYWNNSIGLSLTNNNLLYQKGKLIVTGGSYNYLSSEFYSKSLGGDYDYTTLIGETKQFYTPWSEGPTFAFRLKLGDMLGAAGDNSPHTDRFSIGGPTTIRGYSDIQSKGTQLVLANGEIRFYPKAFDNVSLVGFYDYGWVDTPGESDAKHAYSTYGVGVRFNLPMLGAMRLDYGLNGEGDTHFTFFFGEMF
jgi:outer membrane protein insertion porin family